MTKISSLSDIGTGIATNDTFVLVDASDPTTPNKKVQQQNLLAAGGLLPDGSASTPALRFTNDGNTGIYRSGTDTLAISTNGTGRLFVDASGKVGVGTSTITGKLSLGANQDFVFGNQLSTGTGGTGRLVATGGEVYFQAGLAATSGSNAPIVVTGYGGVGERLRITSDGKLGLGTSSPQAIIHSTPSAVNGGLSTAFIATQGGTGTNTGTALRFGYNSTDGAFSEIAGAYENPGTYLDLKTSTDNSTAASTKLRITAAGNVGVGTTTVQAPLHIGTASAWMDIGASAGNRAKVGYDSNNLIFGSSSSAGQFIFKNNVTSTDHPNSSGTELARIDSSGRLLVGTSTSRAQAGLNLPVLIEGTGYTGLGVVYNTNNTVGAFLGLSKSRGSSVGSNTIVQDGDQIGEIFFSAADGTDLETRAANISAYVDGTPGANDMPGRLVFSTTPDSSATPVERMRITNAGYVGINTTSPSVNLDVNGVINSGAGSAAAPSITLGADANSGLYSPGADQVAISTNGTGKLFVDASGNVGVGANAPLSSIHVKAATAGLRLEESSASSKRLNISIDNSAVARISAPQSASSIAFETTGAERLRITSTGELKHIGGGSEGSPAVYFAGSAPSNSLYVEATTGHVGLGTSSVSQKLHIGGSNPGDSLIRQDATVGGTNWEIGEREAGKYQWWEDDNDQVRMTLTSTGLLGVGTTGPAFKLHAYDGTGPSIAGVFETNQAESYISFKASGTTSTSTVRIGATGNDLLTVINSSEKMRVDSSGRLLVGTSSARSNFTNRTDVAPAIQVEGTGTSLGSRALSIVSSSSTTTRGAHLYLGHQLSGTIGGNTILGTNNEIGLISFNGCDGSELVEAATIGAFTDGTPGANDMPGRLVFSTTADGASSPTERMRIANDGHTYWGVANPGTTAFGTSIGRLGLLGLFQTARDVDGANEVALLHGNAGEVRIFGDGDLQNTNNSYTGISDVKLKENIIAAGSQWDDLKALQVRKYNFKAETGYNTHTQIGLVAQEVELVSPGLVSESPDRDEDGNDLGTVTKSVNYSVLYMKAVKALQEAMERIEILETEMAAVKAQLG